MVFSFPRIYPILDSSFIPATGSVDFLAHLGRSLADNGVTLLEYRNKLASDAEVIADCEILRDAMPSTENIKLILDDRVHLVERVDFDGVHLDAGDASVSDGRALLGPGKIIGTFAGSDSLIPGILSQPADYFAIGPVFTTTTKQTDKPPIGIDGVRRLRHQAGPDVILTAAAGITFETAPQVLEAGATTVAVAAGIFRAADPAAEFRRWLKHTG